VTDAAALKRRHATFKTQRQRDVDDVWRACFDYTFPLRGNGLSGTMLSPTAGQAKQAELLDSTAADSANVLASNIMGGLTPANALWFALDVGDETDDERRWLDESATLLWENIHMANFDAEAFEACLDIVCAGQFALFIDEDRERGGFAFHQWPLSSVYCGSTRADGRIDIVHHEYTLTAEQAIKEFGEQAVPEKVRKAMEGNKPDEPFVFVQAIYPRTPHVVGAKLTKNMPVASCHFELETGMVCRESGYHEMPVVVPRWLRAPGSVYAVGPMYAALPDVRQLNTIVRLELDNLDIAVSGMWLGIDDGVMNPRTVKLGPRKIIIAADKDSLSPLSSGADFNLSEVKISGLQAAIRKTLMADQLPPADGPVKTAYEYSVRVDMIRKLLGPMYGRLQAEYLKPLVERCFGLAYRAGIFKPAPPSLQGRAFSVRYVSPMARAQKLEEVQAIEAVFASVGQFAAFDPTIVDNLDDRKALELIAEGRGAPSSILRKPEDVAKLQAQRAKAQQAIEAQQRAGDVQQAGAEAAVKASVAA
jgi:hypothetical protein